MTYPWGAVVWGDDPFKDDPEAGRPWLVVGNETQPFHDEQCMAVALSTSGHEAALPIDDDHWIEGGESHTRVTPSRGPSTLRNCDTSRNGSAGSTTGSSSAS